MASKGNNQRQVGKAGKPCATRPLTSAAAQARLTTGSPRSYVLQRILSGIVKWIAYESIRSIRKQIHLPARFKCQQESR